MVSWQRRQGKATEREIGLSLEHLKRKLHDFWYWKVMDYRIYKKIDKALYAPKVPCDYFACFKGKFYAIEVKSSHTLSRYSFQYVQKHQKESLLDIEKAGGEGWILLSWRRWNHVPRQSNRLFGFRIDDWLRIEKDNLEMGYKSVSWNMIVNRGIEFYRDKVWKLDRLFGIYI